MINFMKTLFAKYKGLFFAFLFFGVLIIMVPLAFGIGTPTSGWKVDSGAVRTITSGGTSTQLSVLNTSANAYFVPSKTVAELNAFINHHPINVRVGYCGDGNCDSYIGEAACNGNSIGTCPVDCGVCTGVTTVNYDNFWFAYATGLGPVCGDGRCDTLLGENVLKCSADCSSSKGCCAVRNATASNTSILAKCGVYEANATFPNSINVTPCGNQPACTVINKGNSQNICVRNKNYPCNQISLVTYNASPTSYPNCQASVANVIAKQSCADITDAGVCRSNSACMWIGQSDSPMCNSYCGSGAKDIDPSNDRETCPEDYGDNTGYQCGDGNCVSGYPANENASNCPADCVTATTLRSDLTGGLKIAGSCGDGVCSSSEQGDGQESYCSVDCGYTTSSGGSISQPKVDWGKCESFSTACPSLSITDCAATHICDWSINSISGCSVISIYGSSLTSDSVCSLARTRNDCNRIGCYWDKSAFKLANTYCGDGICNISGVAGGGTAQETEASCPVDCRSAARSYYCPGPAICADKIKQSDCSGDCQWSKAGTITN